MHYHPASRPPSVDRAARNLNPDRPALFGPYSIERQLGQGGCAEVFLARDGQRGRVAVKRPLPHWCPHVTNMQMLAHEAHIGSLVNHPNVAQVLDFGLDGGRLQLVLEYVDGISLRQLAHACMYRGRALPIGTILRIGCELLRGLRHVHACPKAREFGGIVHRDVSPANVLLSRAGEVKLADFGVASFGRQPGRRHGYAVGKVGYMAPEQILGLPVDSRCDLFSVATVLTELLLLRKTFAGESSTEVLYNCTRGDLSTLDRYGADLPSSVRDVLVRALNPKPSRRFRTASSMRRAIERAMSMQGCSGERRDIAAAVEFVASGAAYRPEPKRRLGDGPAGSVDSPRGPANTRTALRSA